MAEVDRPSYSSARSCRAARFQLLIVAQIHLLTPLPVFVADWVQALRGPKPMLTRKLIPILLLLIVASVPARPASPDIYPDPSQAKADLAAALKSATATHRRIILDFGGNWCGDCQVLDIYFHDAQNKPLVDANFVVVHINIGRIDQNVELAKHYEVPLEKGVPALAVLSEHGTLLYSQKNGEFEAMRRMQSSSLTDFLVHWRAPKAGCSAMALNC